MHCLVFQRIFVCYHCKINNRYKKDVDDDDSNDDDDDEYAATIWNPCKEGYIDDLEKVQRRATKLLQNISHFSYPECLVALNLPTLLYRRIRGDMIKTFKILNNIYDSRVTNFLSKSNFSTARGHNFKLFVQHADFNIRKWFFSICIVDIWNRLPSSVVNAPNVMCFEK